MQLHDSYTYTDKDKLHEIKYLTRYFFPSIHES